MKLAGIVEIKGTITLKSGLHIGAGDMEMRIGGTDNPVIKHPHTLEPYIPGSSLKGKVRSLLEMRSGLMPKTGGEPLSYKHLKRKDLEERERQACLHILKLFGSSGAEADESGELGPTRVSFADCPLNEEWKKNAEEMHLALTEVKSENSINRITGTAQNPRFTERVPADTVFDFSVSMKQLGEEEDLLRLLLEGLKLLQMDALGGSGSRGYGRIAFRFEDETLHQRFNTVDVFPS